jgi:vacuolar-type H+-ATPase subunit I/STV1
MMDGNEGSVDTGSPNEGPAFNQNARAGESSQEGQSTDYRAAYEELERKLGAQGAELGEYRNFFNNISGLLEKLDEDPVLVQAIMDGKITRDLAVAVSEGRISVKDAQDISSAHKEVKKELGEKKYEQSSPEQIEKLVEKRIQEVRRELEQSAEMKEFEEKTSKFIQNASDFAEYAEDIDRWLNKHPEVLDVEVAYWAVRGQMSEAAAKKKAEEEAGERAKDFAQNAQGGGVTAQYIGNSEEVIDSLISDTRNPNIF